MPLPPAPPAPPSPPLAVAPPAVRRARALALAAVLALIVLGLAWEAWLAPTGRGTLALKVLPLAAALPGLMRHRMHTYRWLSLLVWLYFAEGVVRATTERAPSSLLAVAEIALTLALFTACVAYIRLRQRAAVAEAA